MRFTVGVGRTETAQEAAVAAVVAEEAGFDAITFVDQPHLTRDVHAMMAVAATRTSRIALGHGVTQLGTMHPVVIANATATIDELSGGRAFIGLGSGGNALLTMDMKPVRLADVREGIGFLRNFISGGNANWRGAVMHSEWSRREIPIIMGCTGPKSSMLGGQLADGVMSVGWDPHVVKWRKALVQKGAEAAGRDPDRLTFWARVMMYVCDDPSEARREVAGYSATEARDFYLSVCSRRTPEGDALIKTLENAYPGLLDDIKRIFDNFVHYEHEKTDGSHNNLVTDRVIKFFNPVGTPREIIAQAEELRTLGVDTVSTVQFTILNKNEMVRTIGREVLGKLVRPSPRDAIGRPTRN